MKLNHISCNTLLTLLSLVQFAVIFFGLVTKNHQIQHNEQTTHGPLPSTATTTRAENDISSSILTPNTSPAIQQMITNISQDTNVVAANSTSIGSRQPAGVAVTMMLHAPKWFQRRYTMMVQNVHNNIPLDWVIQIFYTGLGQSLAGIEINRGISRLIKQGRVVLTVIPKDVFARKKKKFELMTESWIWENMLADKVLLFGGGSVLCSNSPYTIDDFLQFDYIGAPWNAYRGVGGDGGVSVRSRNLMVQVIEYELSKYDHLPIDEQQTKKSTAYKNWGQEDHFFVSRILEMQKKNSFKDHPVRLATKNETMSFAGIGGLYNSDVFAVSGTLPDVPFKERDAFLALCPEIKMFYPSLHDPNCFGAQPDGDKCAMSICALKSKTERKGGC
jgi:hypothetical protein